MSSQNSSNEGESSSSQASPANQPFQDGQLQAAEHQEQLPNNLPAGGGRHGRQQNVQHLRPEQLPNLLAGEPQEILAEPQLVLPPNSPARNRGREAVMNGGRHADEMRGWILVVAALFATITFQAGMYPPGGFWPDDLDSASRAINTAAANFATSLSPPPSNQSNFYFITMTRSGTPHTAGNSVLADKHNSRYLWFYGFNTTAFIYSIVIIFYTLYKPNAYLFKMKTLVIFNIPFVLVSYILGTLTSLRASLTTMQLYGLRISLITSGVIAIGLIFIYVIRRLCIRQNLPL